MIIATLADKLEQLSPEMQQILEQKLDIMLKSENLRSGLLPARARFKGKIKPGFGGAKGLFGKMADYFDEPNDDMKEYTL